MKNKGKLIFAIVLLVTMITSAVLAVVHFTTQDKRAKVVVTTFPIYDICREVMGTEEDLMLLMDNGVDMHSYSPNAGDIASISGAELFIYIGGESEKWVPSVINSANNINLKTLSLMEVEGMTLIEESDEHIIDGEHEHEHGEEGGSELEGHDKEHEHEHDEHIWLSIKNAIVMTESIRDSLTLVYPERQELFKVNAEKYISKLRLLDSEYESSIKGSAQTLIFADRFPFRYMVNDYNLKYYAVFSGCSTETEASTETIAKLVEKINECNVDYILVLETSDKKVANSCKNNGNCKSGLEILEINSCQSINHSTMQTDSYLQIMTKNLVILKKALT